MFPDSPPTVIIPAVAPFAVPIDAGTDKGVAYLTPTPIRTRAVAADTVPLRSLSGPESARRIAAGTPLSPDTVADLLDDERRQRLLSCLEDYDDPVALADLADEVAVRERDTSITSIPGEAILQVYMSLYHTHVPMLADADVVEYSQKRDLVGLAANAADLLRNATGFEGGPRPCP